MATVRRPKLAKELLDRGERAAIAVGYSPRNARRMAARLLRRPQVIALLEQKQREAREAQEAEADANYGTA